MRIRFEQLQNELQKKVLPLYFVSGDEPLLVQEALDAISAAAKQQGYSERKVLHVDRQFDWQSLQDEANSLSLFAEQKLIVLKLGSSKPGTPGSKALQAYCKSLPEGNILIIESAKMDAASLKSKWAQAIDQAGAIIQVWPVGIKEMPQWLSRRASTLGLVLDGDARDLLSDRLEGNLLAAQQALEKLKLFSETQTISADIVLENVSDAAKYDVFKLTDACLEQDAKQVVKVISHLRMEGFEVSIALWALTKEIRILSALANARHRGLSEQTVFKQFRVINKRQSVLSRAAQDLTISASHDLLNQCKQIDDLIKGADIGLKPWEALEKLSLAIAKRAI